MDVLRRNRTLLNFFSQQVCCHVLADFLNSLLEMRCINIFGLLELRISRALKRYTCEFNSSGPVGSSTGALVLNKAKEKYRKLILTMLKFFPGFRTHYLYVL